MLLVLISFVAWQHDFVGCTSNEALTFESILGLLFALGLAHRHTLVRGRGRAVRHEIALNEVIAMQFSASANLFSEHSRMIMLYALCGFANLGSLGILLGGLSVLVPERKSEYLVIAPKSVICGTLINLITGAIVGLVYLI